MLVAPVLDRLGEAQRRVARVEEGEVIPAAQVAVAPPRHVDRELRHVALAGFPHEARELARRQVVLAARAQRSHDLGRHRGVRRHAFGEEAHARAIDLAVGAARVADDVVGDHPGDHQALRLRVVHPRARAE